MTEPRQCPQCGAEIEPGAVGGHCASCLLRIGLAVAGAEVGLMPGDRGPPAGPPSQDAAREPILPRIRSLGDYEVLEEISHGGMGIVYKARQISLNRVVALKLIRAGELANEAEVLRFRAEAEAAAHLDHPNIVPILEVGEHEGRHYFSMKLIEGGTLSERISDRSFALSDRDAARLLATIARAVHYAHQRGLLHRDLKPGNILLDGDGQPHITDFGLAKRIDADSAMTQSGAMVGTPSYVAPEQAAGVKQLTMAADVYSLGAILYELLAGRPPFAGATVIETLHEVMHGDLVRPSVVRHNRRQQAVSTSGGHGLQRSAPAAIGVDRDLEVVCLKCLEKDPARRYGTAEALADDLERWLRHEPLRARPVSFAGRVRKWAQRNRLLAAGVASLFLVGALGLTGILWQWGAAVAARRAIQEELWHSQLLDARSYRLSSGPGRRTKALEILALAAAHRPSVELRNEAIATLVLPDLGSNVWWRDEVDRDPPRAFTSDLTFHAGPSGDGRVSVWRGAEPEPVARLKGTGASAKTMRFSPDDSLLAVKFEDGVIGVWRWRDQQLFLQTRSWPDGSSLPSYDFAPNGREFWLSDSEERIARYSLPDGQPLPPPAIAGRARRMQFDPTGRRLVGWSGRTLTAWDVGTGSQLGEWQAPGDVWCLAWHPGGNHFVLGAVAAGMRVAEIGQKNLEAFASGPDANAVFTSLGFTPDGSFVIAGGWGDLFDVWNFGTRQQELRSRSNCYQQISRDGAQVAVQLEGQGYGVRAFHQPIGIRRLRVPTVLGENVQCAAWHPGGRWLVTGHPSGWALWDAASGQPLAQRKGGYSRSVQFLPSGDAFLSGGDDGAQLWPFAVKGSSPLVGSPRSLTPPNAVLHERAALSPDGKRFAAVGDHSWLGSVAGETAPIRIADGDGNNFVHFSPDGRWLALCRWRGTHLKIRDAFTGAMVTNLPAGTASALFAPTGDQLVSVLPDRATFWQVGTWARLREIPFGDEWKHSDITGFWPDGSCVLSSGREAAVQLWNLEANAEIATLWLPMESRAWAAVFDPAVRRMAMPADRPCVDLWDLATLRRELARLGLDWPGEPPSERFAPRR